MHQIQSGIWYEDTFPGVTIGTIILSKGTLFIDSPLRKEDIHTWRSSLNNWSSGSQRLLINLDHHDDRTLGMASFECTTITHAMTALTLRDRPAVFKGHTSGQSAEWENYPEVLGTRWVHPGLTFTERINLHWDSADVVLEHHPGPNPGAIWVSIPDAKVIFVGDTVVSNQTPFLAAADLRKWIVSLDLLLSPEYKDFIIISGRGGRVGEDEIHTQRALLIKIQKRLNLYARRKKPPESTENIIPTLISYLAFPLAHKDFYIQRLKYGLRHYYMKEYEFGEM